MVSTVPVALPEHEMLATAQELIYLCAELYARPSLARLTRRAVGVRS